MDKSALLAIFSPVLYTASLGFAITAIQSDCWAYQTAYEAMDPDAPPDVEPVPVRRVTRSPFAYTRVSVALDHLESTETLKAPAESVDRPEFVTSNEAVSSSSAPHSRRHFWPGSAAFPGYRQVPDGTTDDPSFYDQFVAVGWLSWIGLGCGITSSIACWWYVGNMHFPEHIVPFVINNRMGSHRIPHVITAVSNVGLAASGFAALIGGNLFTNMSNPNIISPDDKQRHEALGVWRLGTGWKFLVASVATGLAGSFSSLMV